MKNFDLLSSSFLFQGLSEEELSGLLLRNEPIASSYKKGELIYSSASSERLVGFIVSGGCEVRRERGSCGPVLLNLLGRGDSFGILSVFSDGDFPTSVYAARSCEILFFTDRQIQSFIAASPTVNQNLIRFLAGRIAFLNKKIATFSGNRVEDRLAAFLLCEAEKYSSDVFPFNYVKCGEEINAGRASVYRAVNALCEAGLISVSEKQVNILDPKGLGGIGSI